MEQLAYTIVYDSAHPFDVECHVRRQIDDNGVMVDIGSSMTLRAHPDQVIDNQFLRDRLAGNSSLMAALDDPSVTQTDTEIVSEIKATTDRKFTPQVIAAYQQKNQP